ncbi:SNF2 family helicase [Colletotrichum tofieldiae]|nr:SNF2 family helicase [Colletotrichum tofieldiae]GKT81583.1 SNF2 family helicase [Colletotrichum tofieldiae]GKT97560.1 SNF2 family helicase [Colletotrichum tofieldiae]
MGNSSLEKWVESASHVTSHTTPHFRILARNEDTWPLLEGMVDGTRIRLYGPPFDMEALVPPPATVTNNQGVAQKINLSQSLQANSESETDSGEDVGVDKSEPCFEKVTNYNIGGQTSRILVSFQIRKATLGNELLGAIYVALVTLHHC